MHFGSRMDIVCTVMWITSSTLICAHFPTPKLRVVHDSDYVRKLPLEERQQKNPAFPQQLKKKRRPKWPVRQRHEDVGGGDMGLEYHAKRLTPGVSGSASAAGSSGWLSKPPPSGDDTAPTYYDDGTTYYDDGQTYMDDGQTYMDDGQTRMDDGQTYMDDGQTYMDDGQTYMDDGQTYMEDDENQTFFQDGEQSSATRSYNPGDYE